MKQFGNTWWGQNWLKALEKIDFSNRLPRGRAYARNGSVREINIKGNQITAKVKGSRPSPYKITITVPAFSAADQKTLSQAIQSQPSLLGQLLNRSLPTGLNELAESKGIRIFPRQWKDLNMNCSCPDYAVPCKHLAAVINLIANEIDLNPFLVFLLHDYDVLESLKKEGMLTEGTAEESIPALKELLLKKAPDKGPFFLDQALYERIDLSGIQLQRERLLGMLSPSPGFYSGDFRALVEKAYKKIAKGTAVLLKDGEETGKYHTELLSIEGLHFEADERFDSKGIVSRSGEQQVQMPWGKFEDRLWRIEPGNVFHYADPVIALYGVFRFCMVLLEKNAIVPRVMKTGEQEYRVNWAPALFDPEVKKVFDQLRQICPSGLVEFHFGTQKKKEILHFPLEGELEGLCTLILNYYVPLFCKGQFPDSTGEWFFGGYAKKFSTRAETALPATVQAWLSNFSISHRDFVPIIQVEEATDDHFDVNVWVEDRKDPRQQPISLSNIFSKNQYAKARTEVLQGLSRLAEHFPQISKAIDSLGAKSLRFDADGFVAVFFEILPAIRVLGINILLPKGLRNLVSPHLALSLKSSSSASGQSFLKLEEMLSFDWKIAIGEEALTREEFLKRVKGLSGIVRIKDQYLLIDQAEIDKLIKQLEKPPKVNSTDLLKSALTGTYEDKAVLFGPGIRELIEPLLKAAPVPLPGSLHASLRPYQVRGYEWMHKNSALGFGSLIADDMGLGKTLQVIALLLKFKQEGAFDKLSALIIVPTTLISNWQNEIRKFAPDLSFHIYHGPKRHFPEEKTDILLTTYGTVRSDLEALSKPKWHALVIDEAQNIKNPQTAQTQALKKIKASIRIAMSGTPVENRLSEYWSIMDFANRGYLGTLGRFTEDFAKPIQTNRNQQRLDIFRKMTEPFILRRLKSDKSIISDLPDKIQNNQYCALSKEQAALYQNVVDQNLDAIAQNEGIARRGLVLKLINALKQVCNHPVQFLKKGEPNPEESGKTTLLFNLLETIYANYEKTLIFTQYKEMGDLLVQLIHSQFGMKPLFLHGGCSRNQRDEMVSSFQENRQVNTLILSLKAGGTGLNLTAAANVIHFDLWWNPAVEAQATDRAYRIGQKQNVMVWRLISQGTFEEKIDAMIQSKKELADLTVSTGENWIGDLSDKDLKDLVKLRG